MGVEAGDLFGLVGVAVEAVGEDEKGGGPEADEDAEAFGVGGFFGGVALEEPPDGDGEDDGEDLVSCKPGASGRGAGLRSSKCSKLIFGTSGLLYLLKEYNSP